MIMQDLNKGPLQRAAIVKAKAAKARRNAKLATILVNVVGSLIGALCVVYSVHVVLG
jgi:fluoride ion exporter CrcB/FEX